MFKAGDALVAFIIKLGSRLTTGKSIVSPKDVKGTTRNVVLTRAGLVAFIAHLHFRH